MYRSLLRSTFAVLLLVCATAPVAQASRFLRAKDPIKGRYIVTLKDSVPAEQVELHAQGLARQHGGKLLGTMNHAMKGFGVSMTEERARALMHNPLVEQVEEDGRMYLSAEPIRFDFKAANAPALRRKRERPKFDVISNANLCAWNTAGYYVCEWTDDSYWVLDRLDNRGSLYSYKAYAYNSTGGGVRAYVVDTGVWYAHDELVGRVESGANMTVDPDVTDNRPVSDTTEEPGIPADYSPANDPCNGTEAAGPVWGTVTHGTSIASLIGGTNTGVAKDVKLIPVKVISCVDGTGSKLAVARGLDWIQGDMAGRAGRAVVNMSMFFDAATGNEATQLCENGSGGMVNCVSALENEVSQIVAQNIVFVTSANNQGNGNCTTVPARMGYGGTYSATYRPITVGATTYTNTNGTYTDSRWAGANPSNYGTCVSIWAPGSRLRIATTRGTSDYYQQNAGGTSYASAITSGVVARLLQWYPSWSAQQVWNELVSRANSRYTATDFDPSAHTNTKLVYISHTE